ncbi:HAT dimerisation domain, C-terminal [Ostreococcus tauri]|uniref:HAT dimerisation domain, C-terminal n=1 Tax=Ostreococcus tauri TaxID=70448 RepID=A0A090M2R3_OSTTA|nr:HAT dimerisation domain, C-terminal [Ostreococcus tauri]CEF98491.1 HAT dimerisation domain, C-terminal [Ostreococcus tauri]|eukprot:XP_022839290.1 HAT dimerisation domain, C-terminal [Ostreococcus tauri]
MIKSILDNWGSVDKILSDTEIHIDLNKSLLKVMVDLLEDFERIFKELQTFSSPSICFVLKKIFLKLRCFAFLKKFLNFKYHITQKFRCPNAKLIWTATFSKTEFFFPKLLTASNSNCIGTPLEEIERYCRQRVPFSRNFEAIEWWKNNVNCYPHLSKLALKLLSIPASSAAAERAFSLLGDIITKKRNRLCPKSVDSLLFLHSYYKNLNSLQ